MDSQQSSLQPQSQAQDSSQAEEEELLAQQDRSLQPPQEVRSQEQNVSLVKKVEEIKGSPLQQ